MEIEPLLLLCFTPKPPPLLEAGGVRAMTEATTDGEGEDAGLAEAAIPWVAVTRERSVGAFFA